MEQDKKEENNFEASMFDTPSSDELSDVAQDSLFQDDTPSLDELSNTEQAPSFDDLENTENNIDTDISTSDELTEDIENFETSKDIEAIDEIQAIESIETVSNENIEIEENYNTDNTQEMITVRPVKFPQFELDEPNRAIKKNLDILQDVSMHISVELGRTKSTIREVMDMEEGSIVELDKIAGEQVEIYVNGKLVAKGEVIVIEDRFGVRVTSTNLPKTEQ